MSGHVTHDPYMVPTRQLPFLTNSIALQDRSLTTQRQPEPLVWAADPDRIVE
jgi:hypothetical protein